jgi:hypothetical protein
MNERLALSKVLSVALSSAVSASLLIGFPLSVMAGTIIETMIFTSIVGAVAAVLGVVLGFPVILVSDHFFPRIKFRHIAVAPVCAVMAWLVVEGAFSRDGWSRIWGGGSFWLEWAPKRLAVVVAVGLLAGLLYTAIWPRLRRKLRADP